MVQPLNRKTKTLGQLLPEMSLPADLAALDVSGLSIDSRKVQAGFLFVAVQGIHQHGLHFVDKAQDAGAVAILMESDNKLVQILKRKSGLPYISIPNLEQLLSKVAGRFFDSPSEGFAIVGITGTNGKTTCSQLLAQLLALHGEQAGVLGTMGYGIFQKNQDDNHKSVNINLTTTGMTTPDPITTQALLAELSDLEITQLAMEVSSHGLVQGRVADVSINTAVFTNLSHDHLDYHGDMQTYGEAKSRLFTMPTVSHSAINIDDDYGSVLIEKIQQKNPQSSITTYSIENSKATIYLSNINVYQGKTSAILHTPDQQYDFSTQLVGRFNLSNILAVLAALYQRADFAEIIELLPLVKAVKGRMESLSNSLDKQVIIDYAHTPDALKNALQAARESMTKDSQKLWCVFGCGGDRDKEKRPVMASMAETYSDEVVLTSDNPRNENPKTILQDVQKGFSIKEPKTIADREEAIRYAIQQSDQGDIIVIAGKGHEDYQLVKGEILPFSDHEIARLALRELEGCD